MVANKYKGKIAYDEEMNRLRMNHSEWKEWTKKEKKSFFVIYSSFKNSHLKDISGGAMKLYIYLGFHVNNTTGECWHSVETISDYFGNDPRTVKKWFQELEERKLIMRIQKGYKHIANTFMLPYDYPGGANIE